MEATHEGRTDRPSVLARQGRSIRNAEGREDAGQRDPQGARQGNEDERKMSNLQDRIERAAKARLVARVNMHIDTGDPVDLHIRVPTGLEAAECITDFGSVGSRTRELMGHLKLLDNIKEGDDEADEKIRLANESKKNRDDALYAFALKWLPRLCEELDGYDDDEMKQILHFSGGLESPAITTIVKLVATGGGIEEEKENESLRDLLFLDMSDDQLQAPRDNA